MATATRMTADEYYEISVEGDRTQLVEGAIIVNEPKPIHGLLQVRLASAIHVWIEAGEDRGLAITPTSITLDEHNVYGPDLLWFSEERRPPDMREYPEALPNLCVEIRSPGTWRYDVEDKRRVYELRGLPELWLVDDRAELVLVGRRSKPDFPRFDITRELGRGDTVTSPQLPGFELALEKLFSR
ncbi:MAG: Uma2 family endonuclease [Thermoleophilaceae bacterium]|nr:Uma2 family endonuclease [Thermoleophilaceae bacterium]